MTGFLMMTGIMIALGLAFVLVPLMCQRKAESGSAASSVESADSPRSAQAIGGRTRQRHDQCRGI